MATAFQTGFLGGTAMYNNAERNRLAQEQSDREAAREVRANEEFGWRRDAEARQRDKDTQVDSYTQQLTRPNAENYALLPKGATTTGLRMPGLEMSSDAMDTASVPPIGGLRMPAQGSAAPGTGLRTPAVQERELTFNQAPTGAAAEELLGRIAVTKGDTQGFRASQVAARGYKYDDAYKKHMTDWNSMKDEDRSTLIDKLSYDSGVKGFGTWVAGKGKAQGYMNYMPPNGDPVKLSAKEAGDLYALTNMMEVDPARARAEMDKVSDKVRAVASHAFEATSKGVTANNQATRFANADANDAARTGLMGQELGLKRELNSAHIGAYERSNQSPIVALTAEAERLVKAGTFKDVPTAIEALKKGSAKREVDPKAYAETMAKFTEVYGDPRRAAMETDRLFGLTAPTNAVAESLKALNDKKGAAKPGAAAPAAPAAQLGLTQRLGNAVGADNSNGNRNQFMSLAAEAEANAPGVAQQIEALRRAVPMTRSAGERNNLETRIGELEGDLGMYRSILEQRNAQRGY